MAILACGINHKTAPVALREQFAFAAENVSELLQALVQLPHIHEAVLLATCNRTEIYCAGESAESILHWLMSQHGLTEQTIKQHWYVHQDEAAVQHIMRVACGLDSMVLGEPQILGQVKQAYLSACEVGTIGPQLEHLFPLVFATSKRVRTHTTIGVHPVSIAYTAVDLIKREFADLQYKTVLVLGAGDTIELVLQHVCEWSKPDIIIANRHVERAQRLAKPYNATGISLTELPRVLAQADVIVSATASTLPILGKGAIESACKTRRNRPLLLIDLAVPRDIEPEVGQLNEVTLYNVDDLQHVIARNVQNRENAARHAEQIVEIEMWNFIRSQRGLKAKDLICAYRHKIEGFVADEVERAQQALQNEDDIQDVLAQLANRLANKIMHHPCTELRSLAQDDAKELVALARQLLGIKNESLVTS